MEDDFHLHRSAELEICGTFALTPEERKTVSEALGVPIESLKIRKIGRNEGNVITEYQVAIPDYGNPLLNPFNVNTKTLKDYKRATEENKLPQEFSGCTRVGETKELLTKYLMDAKLKPQGTKWIDIKTKDLEPFLPSSLYIPAFENIEKHTEYKKTNFFGLMLQNVFQKLEENTDYKRFKMQYENLTKRIFSPDANRRVKDIVEFEESLTGYIQEILPTRVSLNFSVPEVSDFLLNNFVIHLDDGVKTPVTGKGHGAQRAIIWALLRYFLDNLKADSTKSTIFLVEEPELYLHPQAQRVMLKTLKELAERGQVIYSSHSPVFVDLEHPQSIRVVRKQGTEASIYTLPKVTENDKEQIRYLKWMGDAQNEIFFAKSVILYEGATEKLILTHMNKHPIDDVGDMKINRKIAKPMNFDELGCQLISTGGKFSMPFFTKLLIHARIPFYVIYDKDSSNGEHEMTNRHIENNIRLAKSKSILAESKIHHPYLEADWNLPYNENEKADTIYELLKSNTDEWPEKMRMKYENLRKGLYKFAWNAFLGNTRGK